MEGLLQLIKSLGLSGLMLGGTGIGDVGEFYDAFLYFFFPLFVIYLSGWLQALFFYLVMRHY